MAGKKRMGDKWQYTFKRKGVLEKPLYLTFSDEKEGDEYARKLDALLDRGIVPTQHQPEIVIVTIESLVRQYLREGYPKQKDIEVLNTIFNAIGNYPLVSINAKWLDGWISDLKRVKKLRPATIRAKVGALARCLDWGIRREIFESENKPWRTLPNGYATYNELDEKLAGEKKEDNERDRRLEPGEYEKILSVIDRGILTRVQRPYTIVNNDAVRDLFNLALESSMRLREMYTITKEQVKLQQRTIFLEKTKNGEKRQVPLTTIAMTIVERRMKSTDGDILFPWWNGDLSKSNLKLTTNYLSHLFANIFEDAGCGDFRFHDLRHEAISRLFERTSMSVEEIMKIVGHLSHRMTMRYLSLRGSDLAKKLW